MASNSHAVDINAMLDDAEAEGTDVSDIRETNREQIAEELEDAADRLDAAAVRAPGSVESRLRDLEVDCRELARVCRAAEERLTDAEVAEAMYHDPYGGQR